MTSNILRFPTLGPILGEREPAFLRDETLPEIFRASARRSPASPAAVFGDRTVDYAELDRLSDRAARALRDQGVGRGSFVGLWMTRSLDLHVALLGILKTGAAYIPFDADAPADRVAVSLKDCGARVIVVDAVTGAKAGSLPAERLPFADLLAAASSDIAPDPRAEGLTPGDPAYAIYTSGSTGTPKGIVISHRNICHYLRSANSVYGVVASDVAFQAASVAFDLSLEEIFIPYLAGASLWIASQEVLRETERLPDVLEAAGVTVLDVVPTLLAMLPRDVASLRVIILGGEACPPALAERFGRPGRRLFNSYGPTESTVVATVAEIMADEPITIGRPIPNYSCYVVDEELKPVQPGVRGELLIGGPGVAGGYLGRPELTAQKFISNPFASPEAGSGAGFDAGVNDPVLYRSGDAVSLDEGGRLVFHGRIDDQVKIRGFRVELGEIESRMAAFPGVAHAAAVLRQDDGIDLLAAFLAAKPGQTVDKAALKAELRAALPCYMVPARFEIVEELPRLASGKVDRNRLRALELTPEEGEAQELPGTPTEAALLEAVKKVFPGQSAPLDADFFLDLGGHSLLAARFLSVVRQTPALACLTLQDVYDLRTLRAMAAKLDERALETGATGPRDLSFSPPPLLRRFLCGLAQAAALPVILTLSMAPWLGIFVSYMFLTGDDATWIEEAVSLFGVYTLVNILTIVVALGAKWLVIGRTKPGRYPLWGVYYYRWWLAQRFVSLIHIKWLQGSPVMRFFLRALGAEIGEDAIVADIESGAHDLVRIGKGATVSGKVMLSNAEVIGDELFIGAVTIGDEAYVGTSCVIGRDAGVGEGAELSDLTALPTGARVGPWERWDGSPARQVGLVDRAALAETATAGRARKGLVAAVHALALLVLPPLTLLPIFPAFALFDRLDDAISASLNSSYLYYLPLLAWPTAVVLVLATVALIAAVRWLVLPRVRAGSYSIHGGFYTRKWIVALATELTLETLSSLFATVYMRGWYRLMGAKIGKDAEVSVNLAGRYDLVEVGEKCFIADEVVLGDEDVRRGWMTLKPVRTAARVFVGNDAVVPPGSDIPTGTLIGIKSKPPEGVAMEPGDTWFGSPPIKLPVRQKFDDVNSAWTFEPSRWRKLGRAVFEALSISFPTMLYITFGTLAMEWMDPFVQERDYATLAVMFMAVSVLVSLALTMAAVLAKWALMGVYKPVVKPMWSWWALRTEAVAVTYWGMAGKALLEHLRGTPFLPWMLRLFGCKIGQGVYMDTTDVTEFDCVTIGDFSVLNDYSALQTHLYEDRVMKVGRVEVGRGVTVGPLSTVLYDAMVGDFARLGPLTLVMKGESIPAHGDWSGSPAAPSSTRGAPLLATAPAAAPIDAHVQALWPAA